MRKKEILLGLILFVVLVVGFTFNSQILIPSSSVLILLNVVSILTYLNREIDNNDKCAHMAIKIYSFIIAVLNIVISLFLPSIAKYYNLAGLFDGDFVRVTINDMNEFSYGACILLIIYIFKLILHRKKDRESIKSVT